MDNDPLELRLGEPASVLSESLDLLLEAAPLAELVLNVYLQHGYLFEPYCDNLIIQLLGQKGIFWIFETKFLD